MWPLHSAMHSSSFTRYPYTKFQTKSNTAPASRLHSEDSKYANNSSQTHRSDSTSSSATESTTSSTIPSLLLCPASKLLSFDSAQSPYAQHPDFPSGINPSPSGRTSMAAPAVNLLVYNAPPTDPLPLLATIHTSLPSSPVAAPFQ